MLYLHYTIMGVCDAHCFFMIGFNAEGKGNYRRRFLKATSRSFSKRSKTDITSRLNRIFQRLFHQFLCIPIKFDLNFSVFLNIPEPSQLKHSIIFIPVEISPFPLHRGHMSLMTASRNASAASLLGKSLFGNFQPSPSICL